MPWHSNSPDGSKSVKQNESIIQDNTTYIEDTMDKDHYWDVGSNEDGRHRYVNMNTQGSDPSIATGMGGLMYVKEVAGRKQGFFRNANGIYQFIPSFLSGTVSLSSTSTYSNVVSVPNNTYGFIYMFIQNGSQNMASGSFKAAGNVVHAYSNLIYVGNSTTASLNVRFGNGDQASGLNIRARRTSSGASGTYQYRIVYWGI